MSPSLTPSADALAAGETSLRAKIPADVDAADRLAFDLTFHQLAVLAAAAVPALVIWALLARTAPTAPPAVRAIPLAPIAAVAFALAVGRRDGLPLDAWLLAAAIFRHRARRLLPVPTVEPPSWAPPVTAPAGDSPHPAGPPGLLRLPADAIAADGTIRHRDGPLATATVLVAATTVNVALRTPGEQAALAAGLGRWLNGLTTSVQIVVSTRRVDLPAHAVRLAERAHHHVTEQGLATAALEHAEFLLDLAERLDPLTRTVTIAATATGGPSPETVARRTAEHTVTALSALGAGAVLLDGPAATAVLTAATDPYQAGDATWTRTTAGAPVTGHTTPVPQTDTPKADTPRPDTSLTAAVGPDAVEVFPRRLRVGSGWTTTLVATGYPAEVGLAWLDVVLRGSVRLDAAVHIDPLPPATAAAGLRKARARLEATRRLDSAKGRLGDPLTDVAAEDAADLADRLARGQTRLFRVGVYLTVHAPTGPALAEAVAQVQAAAASVLVDTRPATWRHLQGWTSTLPLGHDALRHRRVFDTDALALSFPMAGPDLPGHLPGRPSSPSGVLLGVSGDNTDATTGTSAGGTGVVWWDRWSQHNHNTLVLARSGAGKSYLVKLEILRSLHDGVEVAVIDPDDEYAVLAHAVDGTVIALGRPGVRVNPFDIPPGDTRPDALTRRALFLHTLVAVLLGAVPPAAERAALDTAITATYTSAGITHHPGTWRRRAPLLRDLVTTLGSTGDQAGATLAARLTPWTTGSFKDLFDGPTSVRTTPAATGQPHPLTVWSTRHLPDELRAAGMLLALDAVWRGVDAPPPAPSASLSPSGPGPGPGRPRRMVVVDEAWTLLREGEGARFLFRLAKSARKRHAGLTVVTQDVADLLGSDLGHAVAANAATQILMRQSPQAIDAVRTAFALTAGETRLLLAAGRGQALLVAGGGTRVAFQAVASPGEHALATTGLDT